MKICTILFIFLMNLEGAWADCGLSINASNVTINWDLNFSTTTILVTVTKANNPTCDYGLAFTKGGAGTYATRRVTSAAGSVRYQIYSDPARTKILKDKPDITSTNDVIMDAFGEGINLQKQLQYIIEVPYDLATSPTLAPSGAHTDTFTIYAYEGADPLAWGAPVASSNVVLTVNVPKIIALSLVDSGGSFDEAKTTKSGSFGTLFAGQSVGFDVRVRTNAGYQVTFSSDNNGNLKHVSGVSLVPYNFIVNGVTLNMANSAAVPVLGLSGAGQTAMSGHSYPVRAVIGAFTGAQRVAGEHRDRITVVASTIE